MADTENASGPAAAFPPFHPLKAVYDAAFDAVKPDVPYESSDEEADDATDETQAAGSAESVPSDVLLVQLRTDTQTRKYGVLFNMNNDDPRNMVFEFTLARPTPKAYTLMAFRKFLSWCEQDLKDAKTLSNVNDVIVSLSNKPAFETFTALVGGPKEDAPVVGNEDGQETYPAIALTRKLPSVQRSKKTAMGNLETFVFKGINVLIENGKRVHIVHQPIAPKQQ